MFGKLFQYLNAAHPLSPEIEQHLSSVLKTELLPRKHLLLKKGQVCNHIYFVEYGLMRSYYLKDQTYIICAGRKQKTEYIH